MKIRKYWPLFAVVVIVLILIAGKIISGSKGQNDDNQTTENKAILFYGDTCPHCKNVDQYLEENKVRERFSFEELEVYNNTANAARLTKTAKKCGFNTASGVGVPFFYDGQNCLIGDRDIINFFRTK